MNVLPVSRLRIANIAQITNETPEQRQQRPDVINERVRTQLLSTYTKTGCGSEPQKEDISRFNRSPPSLTSLSVSCSTARPAAARAPAPRSTTVRDTVRVRSLLDKGASATRVCPLRNIPCCFGKILENKRAATWRGSVKKKRDNCKSDSHSKGFVPPYNIYITAKVFILNSIHQVRSSSLAYKAQEQIIKGRPVTDGQRDSGTLMIGSRWHSLSTKPLKSDCSVPNGHLPLRTVKLWRVPAAGDLRLPDQLAGPTCIIKYLVTDTTALFSDKRSRPLTHIGFPAKMAKGNLYSFIMPAIVDPFPPSVRCNSSGNGNGSSGAAAAQRAARRHPRSAQQAGEEPARAPQECFELLKRQLPATPTTRRRPTSPYWALPSDTFRQHQCCAPERLTKLIYQQIQTSLGIGVKILHEYLARYDSMNALRKTKSDFDRVIPAAITEPCAHATFMTECSMASFI
ncbi:hypothetical protein EVAR_11612_1 [Eumeta japonica]|uniref:Uncharacterized protein n=1 Tax=Eumeta variegata TaxID=151549 RepID=A0A4C1WU71_EUMVA|nr:hypothetical protein EVAR_11612_1 [Eumeta japonica]